MAALRSSIALALTNPKLDLEVYPGDKINVPRKTLVMIQLRCCPGRRRAPFGWPAVFLTGWTVWRGRFAVGGGRRVDRPLRLDFNPAEGIVLSTQPNALASVNGQPVRQAVLRNGDAT